MQAFSLNLTGTNVGYSPGMAETFSYIPIDCNERTLFANAVVDPTKEGNAFGHLDNSMVAYGNFYKFAAITDVKILKFATPPEYKFSDQPLMSAVTFPAGFEYTGYFSLLQLLTGAVIVYPSDPYFKITIMADITASDTAFSNWMLTGTNFNNTATQFNIKSLGDIHSSSWILTGYSLVLSAARLIDFDLERTEEEGTLNLAMSGRSTKYDLINSYADFKTQTVQEIVTTGAILSSYNLPHEQVQYYESVGQLVAETNNPRAILSSYNLTHELVDAFESVGQLVGETNNPRAILSSYNLPHEQVQYYESVGRLVQETNNPRAILSSYNLPHEQVQHYEQVGYLLEEIGTPKTHLSSYDASYYSLTNQNIETFVNTHQEIFTPYIEITSYHVDYYSLSNQDIETFVNTHQEIFTPYIEITSYHSDFYQITSADPDWVTTRTDSCTTTLDISGYNSHFYQITSADPDYVTTRTDSCTTTIGVTGILYNENTYKAEYKTPLRDECTVATLLSGITYNEALYVAQYGTPLKDTHTTGITISAFIANSIAPFASHAAHSFNCRR